MEKESPVRLRLAQRDVRVADAPEEISSAGAFAEEVMARRSRRGLAAPRPDLVLLRRPEPHHPVVERTTREGDRYDVALQATLVLPLARLLHERVAGQTEGREPAAIAVSPIAQTLVRLLARTVRVERETRRAARTPARVVAAVAGSTPEPAAAGRAGEDVPRVVARHAAKEAHGLRESTAPSTRELAKAGGAPAAVSVRLDELPQGELNRLTDRVVRALDRRAIAYRERTGRA